MAADDVLISSDIPAQRVRPDVPLYRGIAALVVVVGVLGIRGEAGLMAAMTSTTYVHILFGSLLWGLVISRFCWWLKYSPSCKTAEVREFSRQLSRMVYLILYLVIGVKQIFGIVNFMWLGGTSGFELLRDNAGGVPGFAMLVPTTDCQVILAYGLIALVLIRLSAYLVCLRLVDRCSV
jgi:cytochrome b561